MRWALLVHVGNYWLAFGSCVDVGIPKTKFLCNFQNVHLGLNFRHQGLNFKTVDTKSRTLGATACHLSTARLTSKENHGFLISNLCIKS